MTPEVTAALGAGSVAVARPRSRLAGFGDRLAERVNPLLLKEVRQSLRGKFFKVSMLITLAFTTLAGIVVLGFVIPAYHADIQHYEGVILFLATFGCTALGAAGLVPFAAFSSMNAESEENTLELLVLSNLSPWAIVVGKLTSSVIQTALMCSVALPFAVVAWNLGGLPPSVLVLGPLGTILGAACFSAIGIAMSTLSRTRWVRILLMVLFGFFLLNMVQNVLAFAFMGALAAFLPGAGATGVSVPVAGFAGVSTALGLAFLAIAMTFACDLLAHREESGSTPMRRVTTVLALLGAGLVIVVCWSSGSADGLFVLCWVLGTLAVPLAWCCTEKERLSSGPRARPPRGGPLSVVALLHTSGGGRGALLATVLLGLLFGAFAFGALSKGGWDEDVTQGLVFVLFTWTYLLLPSVVFSPWSDRVTARILARVAIWLFPWLAFAFGCLVTAAVDGVQSQWSQHAANPFYVHDLVSKSTGAPTHLGIWSLVVAAVLLTLALNAWRMLRGVLDVRHAMRARDERERAR